ncbi:LamG-like jellyroll fold domain-containing protein [Lacinutrix salivirga]
MKTSNVFCAALLCTLLFVIPIQTFSQTVDSDNDTVKDFFDVDDDNDGLLDTTECPVIAGAASPQSDNIIWTKNGYHVYTIASNTNGLGYQESGFQQKVLSKGQPLTVLNGLTDFSFPASSSIPGSATSSVGTFANGTLTYEHNYSYRSYEIHQFRVTTAGGFTSGSGPSSGVYIYPEVGNRTGDYYTATINFTEPVASFSFDFVDIFDTNNDGATMNYEVYADGNLIAYFSDNYIGDDAVGNIDLFDADGVFKGSVQAGQNRENTIGFVTDDVVSQVMIRHIAVAGNLASSTHDPHGIDSFAYSFRCTPQIDIDVDNDGIPDNIEGQPTTTYAAPSGSVHTTGALRGLYTNYGTGIIPEDTDGDSTPDYLDTDSDADGIPDIRENGMANTASATDTDNDGLSNTFEGSNNNDPYDSNDEINDPNDLSILPDTDGDLTLGGDLDYRDGLDVFIPNATLDFDGVDDVVRSGDIMDFRNESFTMSAWVKMDVTTGDRAIMGRAFGGGGNAARRGVAVEARGGNATHAKLCLVIYRGNALRLVATSDRLLPRNEWAHVTATYNGSTVNLYVNGKLEKTQNVPNSEFRSVSGIDFTIGAIFNRDGTAMNNHFDGAIDEVRVFRKALTSEQIQQMVYQEIEQNGADVKGVVLPKDIKDNASGTKVAWSDLRAYYPMTNIVTSQTEDHSGNGNVAKLFNITTLQEQTAPMPYETSNNGAWTNQNTWLHGNVWDIEDVANNKDWAIVKINDNITTNASHTHLGLIVEPNKRLRVNGNNEIGNTWYLELNGTLDLQNDSQLVQNETSDLVTSSTGKILRRQEGLSNVFRYNYWSSPIGTTAASSLSDNNSAFNNTNNTSYRLNMLKEASGNIQFTSSFSPPATTPATLSTRWLYIYQSGVSYYHWDQITPSTSIPVGVGYSQKGTGLGGGDFQYVFEGKPNNGTILIDATDTGGPGSVGGSTKTEYLVGNPYPSAIDAHTFIDDNASVSGGAIYLWEQWAGESHYLDEYEGGYATLNKLGKVRAYQFVGLDGANNGSQDGTKTPTRFIPVGQGFMTEIVANGDIEFNNGQRVFKREDLGESVFFRTTNQNTEASVNTNEANSTIEFQKIKLQFITSSNLNRELILGFSDQTTEGFDYGYDARMDVFNPNDLALALEDDKMIIQAYSQIEEDKVIDLVFNADGNLDYSIRLLETENIDSSQNIYLLDTQESIYHDLIAVDKYNFTSEATDDSSRFKLVFTNANLLSVNEFENEINSTLIYANNQEHSLYIKGLTTHINDLKIVNMLGQTVQQFGAMDSHAFENGQPLKALSSGLYIVELNLDNGTTISKKITLK